MESIRGPHLKIYLKIGSALFVIYQRVPLKSYQEIASSYHLIEFNDFITDIEFDII